MKLMTMAAIAMIGSTMVRTTIWAKNPSLAASAPEVTACLDQTPNSVAVYRATAEASEILEAVSVRLAWSHGRACQQPDAIHIRMREETPAKLLPGCLAYALPYQGVTIQLFYDRIQNAVPASVLPHLLAHVLVHEITHILEGSVRHSQTGVMKAHWTPVDYREMSRHPLPFAPEDILLIQNSLTTRRQQMWATASHSGTIQSR